jgi:hypothetical protein
MKHRPNTTDVQLRPEPCKLLKKIHRSAFEPSCVEQRSTNPACMFGVWVLHVWIMQASPDGSTRNMKMCGFPYIVPISPGHVLLRLVRKTLRHRWWSRLLLLLLSIALLKLLRLLLRLRLLWLKLTPVV